MIKTIQLFGMLFMFSSAVVAGTIVEVQNNNELTTVITDGEKVRMAVSASEYVILDASDHSVKVINPQKQLVTFVNVSELTAGSKAVTVQVSITPQGDGQIIAGYKTQKFSYLANGKHCGVLYVSKIAYQTNGVKEFLAAMKIMMDKQRAALGGFASLVDACTLADMQLIDFVNTVGLPMRIEKNGSVALEVKTIKTDVVLADEIFAIPASYKSVDMSGRVIPGSNYIGAEKQAVTKKNGQQQNYQNQQPHIQSQMQPQSLPQTRNMRKQMQQPVQMPLQSGYQMRRLPRIMGQY